MTANLADPPVVAKSGRSFDIAGVRVRLEGGARHEGDRVPELVKFIVDAIRQAQGVGSPVASIEARRGEGSST